MQNQNMRLSESEPDDMIPLTDITADKKDPKKKDGLSKKRMIARDVRWLSFNARVLQEAADPSVPLRERIRFLGIFSNNLDEFFRVRVATLKRMMQFGNKGKMHLEQHPDLILEE